MSRRAESLPWHLAEVLTDLFGTKRADAIESERKDYAILFSQAHIEGVVLDRYSTAIPTITKRHCRADQCVCVVGTTLKIEEERGAAI